MKQSKKDIISKARLKAYELIGYVQLNSLVHNGILEINSETQLENNIIDLPLSLLDRTLLEETEKLNDLINQISLEQEE